MRRYNIVTKRTYQKNGEEKAIWNNVGSLTYLPPSGDKQGGFFMELSMFPTTKFYVFEQKPKEQAIAPTPKAVDPLDEAYPNAEINPDEIPF